MIREILHRGPHLAEQEEDSFSYFPLPDRNSIANKQQSMAMASITFQNFACFDNDTNKLYLNLDVLKEYEADRINFISTVGCDSYHQTHAMIEISEHPITIINGISYFLLAARSCQLDTLKILYMLSQSVYLNSSMLSQLQLNIDKAIDLEDTWDVHNFLYLVGSNPESSSGLHTMADTKELSQAASGFKSAKMGGDEVQWGTSDHLLGYFSEINNAQYRNSALDIDLIRINTKNEYDPFTTRVYSYESVLGACGASLFDHKPLMISKFQHLNGLVLSDELYRQAMTNYEIFSTNMIEGFRSSKKAQYHQLKSEILEPFEEWEMTWLSHTPSFRAKKTQIEEKLHQEFQRIKEIGTIKAEKNQMSFLNNQLRDCNVCEHLGNPKLNRQPIKFSTYHESMRDKIYSLIDTLTSPEWRGQNKPITTSNDLLANMQTRIDINQRKKTTLEEGVRLAEKEKEYLSQLVFAYVSKINPFQVITE